MANRPFLYGELNKAIEYAEFNLTSSDGTTKIKKNGNTLDISVNNTGLITLRQVKKDTDRYDDPIRYYSLFAYNARTKAYDIQIGEEIAIDTSLSDDNATKIETAWVKTDEKYVKPARDENGNIIYGEDGKPLQEETTKDDPEATMIPIYTQLTVGVSDTGQLVLDHIPASAIVDETVKKDPVTGEPMKDPVTGEPILEYIESILDGNARGEVY